jgi:hypothetical protein
MKKIIRDLIKKIKDKKITKKAIKRINTKI